MSKCNVWTSHADKSFVALKDHLRKHEPVVLSKILDLIDQSNDNITTGTKVITIITYILKTSSICTHKTVNDHL